MVGCRFSRAQRQLVFAFLSLQSASLVVSGFVPVSPLASWQKQKHGMAPLPLLHPLRVSNKEIPTTIADDSGTSTNGANGEEGAPKDNNNKDKDMSAGATSKDSHENQQFPRNLFQVFNDYSSRLWRETNSEARQKIASDKVTQSIRRVQHIFQGEAYSDVSGISFDKRQNMLDTCDSILADKAGKASESKDDASVSLTNENSTDEVDKTVTQDVANGNQAVPAKKKGRSKLFGATMGAAVACWVFSGNYIFTGLFTAMTIIAQLEYYRMVMNTGVYPARRISVIGAASMFVTALLAPDLHQICLPMFGLFSIVQLLSDRNQSPSIPDIATTFTGMFYLGYVPSFWVRIRLLGSIDPVRWTPIPAPVMSFLKRRVYDNFPEFLSKAIHLPITGGAIFIFWSWLSLAFSDVGAYFVGRRFGKTKLSALSAAAGKTSPNKTVEGVVGGCVVSAALATLGAWAQRWPYWQITGPAHGLILGFLGFLGDLTASMLKRDAGLKDFGDLIPEHGGILDRVDSFVWSAPYSWLVCSTILPALRVFATR